MKLKFCILALFICIIFCACSTGSNEDTQNEGFYSVYKNFGNVSTRTALQDGEPVVGVLLKHSSEGAYNEAVYSKDPNSFSIYCLFDNHGVNGDGMEFNYVLYVPEDIFVKYKEANGKNTDSGNPFWWYMVTYYNLNMDSIQSNWPTVIETLCTQNQCPEAKVEDIGSWVN